MSMYEKLTSRKVLFSAFLIVLAVLFIEVAMIISDLAYYYLEPSMTNRIKNIAFFISCTTFVLLSVHFIKEERKQ